VDVLNVYSAGLQSQAGLLARLHARVGMLSGNLIRLAYCLTSLFWKGSIARFSGSLGMLTVRHSQALSVGGALRLNEVIGEGAALGK
jgi:hypothetical protein